jgi:hypothetical protein
MLRRMALEWMLSAACASLLVASAVHAQQSNCAELDAILKLDDYGSLAAERLSIVRQGSGFAILRAPSKTALPGYSGCEVWIEAQRGSDGIEKQTHSLNCDVQKTAAHGNDDRSAVIAAASPWRACLSGWSEKITEDKGRALTGAQFQYSRG